jgi:hypothetical protein
VLLALGTLITSLVHWISGSRRGAAPVEPRGPLPIADEVEGWLWLRDELRQRGANGTAGRPKDS